MTYRYHYDSEDPFFCTIMDNYRRIINQTIGQKQIQLKATIKLPLYIYCD